MILEVAVIQIDVAQKNDFESAFESAKEELISASGFGAYELHECIEVEGRYVVVVDWDSFDDHMVRFHQSAAFSEWRRLLGPFFTTPPEVFHYKLTSATGLPNQSLKTINVD